MDKTITLELDGKELEEKVVTKFKQKYPEIDEDLIKKKAHETVQRLAGKDLVNLKFKCMKETEYQQFDRWLKETEEYYSNS